MKALLIWIGRLAGIVGVIIVGTAVVARLGSVYWLGGIQVGTILQAGMTSTLIACLAYIAALAEGSQR